MPCGGAFLAADWRDNCNGRIMDTMRIVDNPLWPLSISENATGVVLRQNDEIIVVPASAIRALSLALAAKVRQLVPPEAGA